jgi:hypothetical protein
MHSDAVPKHEQALAMHCRVLPPANAVPADRLANALITLERYAEAELLLLDAAKQCEGNESSRRMHWEKVLNALVDLYEGWHAAEMVGKAHPTAEPEDEADHGRDARATRAAEWRARLAEWQATTRPAE